MPSPTTFSKDPKESFFKDPKRLFSTLVPTVVAGAAGLFIIIDGAGASGSISPFASGLVHWASVLVAFALLAGLFSVVSTHISRVIKQQPEWGYSVVLMLSMVAVVVVGLFRIPQSGTSFLQPNVAEEPIRRFFHAVYEPLTSSLLALLAFFSLSTIARAMQRRSVDVLVIVVIALLVLVMQLPPVAELPLITATLQWLKQYLVVAGARGLLIGAAIGTLVAGVRVLLGFDQPYLDS